MKDGRIHYGEMDKSQSEQQICGDTSISFAVTKNWAYHPTASGSYRNVQSIFNGGKMVHIQANMSIVQNLV